MFNPYSKSEIYGTNPVHIRANWTNWSSNLMDRESLLRNQISTDRFILDKERRERKERENRDSGSAKNRDSRGHKENREKDRDRDKFRKHEKSRRDETSEERRIRKEKKRKDEKKSRSEGYLGKLSGQRVGVLAIEKSVKLKYSKNSLKGERLKNKLKKFRGKN